jgi:hypothetical protein
LKIDQQKFVIVGSLLKNYRLYFLFSAEKPILFGFQNQSKTTNFMSGFFGCISKNDCVSPVFYGTDYHSHLGTKRAGLAFFNPKDGFQRAIHSLEDGYFEPSSRTILLSLQAIRVLV